MGSKAHPSSWRFARRLVLSPWFLLAVIAVSALRCMGPLWQRHTDEIFGDGSTYVSFARQLARGTFFWDHPLAAFIEAHHTGEQIVEGPVWNISVREDGKSLYAVAIGYPAFLAGVYRLGGSWLLMHANLVLLSAVLFLFALSVWMGTERNPTGAALGCASALLVPFLDPATFHQLAYPWREPLSYLLVFGAANLALLSRSSGSTRWMFGAAWLLGLACTVKEVNGVYAPWILWMGLGMPRRLRSKDLFLIGCGVATGLFLGAAPLLAQNLVSTGHPLLSLQMLREGMNVAELERGAGLRAGNLFLTASGYVRLYSAMPWVRWVWIPALLGIGLSWRTCAGKMLLGLFASHVGLYLLWGVDLRHMFLALFPIAFFAVYAIWCGYIFLVGRRTRDMVPFLAGGRVILVALPAMFAGRWEGILPPDTTDAHSVASVIRQLETEMPERALVLVNRPLRDVWSLHGRHPVARLHDVQHAGRLPHYAAVLEALKQNGWELVFVDATDAEPRNIGRIDWSVVDREWLLQYYDLFPLATLPGHVPGAGRVTARSALTAYAVRPWSRQEVLMDMPMRPGGFAFIALHPRSAGDDLLVRVGEEEVPASEGGFIPWAPRRQEAATEVAISRRSGAPIPAEPFVRGIGWHEVIRQQTHSFAVPPDNSWFPDGLDEQPEDQGYRSFHNPFRLRLPLRERDDSFSVALLQTGPLREPSATFRVRGMENGEPSEPIDWKNPVFPVSAPSRPYVGLAELLIDQVPDGGIDLHSIQMLVAMRQFAILPPDGARLFALAGRLVPDRAGQGPHAWSVRVDGRQIESGICWPNPFPQDRYKSFVLPIDPGNPRMQVQVHDSGLVFPVLAFCGEELDVRMDQPTRAFCDAGFLPPNTVRGRAISWTRPRTAISVPLSPDVDGYRVRLTAADGRPAGPRILRIRFHDQEVEVPLTHDFREYVIEFLPVEALKQVTTVRMEIDAWLPSDSMDRFSDEALGFRFYRFVWEPIRQAHDRAAKRNGG